MVDLDQGVGVVDKLPPGPNRLTREQVENDQRRRIARSLGECLAEKGYARTTVGDIISRAHVSRQTFYQQYEDKQACLLDVYAQSRRRLAKTAALTTATDDPPMERLGKVVRGYLDIMTEDPTIARVYLIEIYAAGPTAVRERLVLQQGTADMLAAAFGVVTDEERFACRAVVAMIAAVITQELVLGTAESARALYEPLVALSATMLSPSASTPS